VSALKLHPFQREACLSLWEVAERARKKKAAGGTGERCAVIQPTGAGKTIEILAFVRATTLRWQWRALVVEPSKELVKQTKKRSEVHTPEISVGTIVGGKCQMAGVDLVISTAASLHKKRLAKIPRDAFDLVFIDEAHHGAAESYKEILDHFTGATLMVGVTATHLRGDGVSITSAEYFSSVVVYHTIGQLTTGGYLVPGKGFYKHTGLTLENVPIRKGNYDERKLAHAVNIPERNKMGADAWREWAPGRSTVVFCVNIDHAKDMAGVFREQGIAAAAVWGDMDEGEYKQIMEDYEARRVQALVNCRLLCEGWDAAWTSCVLMARPATESAGAVLGPQMIGRALRTDEASGKIDAVIIELMDEKILSGVSRGSQRDLSTLLGLGFGLSRGEVEAGGGFLHEKARRSQVEKGWRERLNLIGGLRTVEGAAETFDIIERVSKVSDYAWIPLGMKTFYMGLADGDFIEVVAETESYFEVRAVEDQELKFIGSGTSWRDAIAIADGWLRRHGVNDCLSRRDQGWRAKEAKPAQVYLAHTLTGLPKPFLSSLRRGQVSDLITSARALLLPVESITLGNGGAEGGSVVGLEGDGQAWHRWQFQSR
jgi:superfamily II DNA or RNA helicase